MTSHEKSDPPKKPKGLSRLKRVWVSQAVSGDVEIQRLSHLAFLERRKHSYRFRMVQGGSVIALFHTKEDLEDALANPTAPTYNEQLSRRMSRIFEEMPLTPDSRGREPLSRDNSVLTPTSKERKTKAERRRVSFGGSQTAPSPAIESDEEGGHELGTEHPPHVVLPVATDDSPAKRVAVEKSGMTEEQWASRRRSLWKPSDPLQEPITGQESALAWHYSERSAEWTCRTVTVRLAQKPFAEGAMREAFKMRLKETGVEREFVAKAFNKYTETEIIAPKPDAFGSIDPNKQVQKPWILRVLKQQPDNDFAVQLATRVLPDDVVMSARDVLAWQRRVMLFQMDVEMQGFCQTYADAYNKQDPPKPVVFLEAFLIVCIDRPELTIYACEPMISGDYIKHNSNCGAVRDGSDARNTPQAFSHFSYAHSKARHIIVDIQGVGDTYTDPQVHSVERQFGLGNLGQAGIDAFFESHQCNSICAGLGLSVEDSEGMSSGQKGTVFVRN